MSPTGKGVCYIFLTGNMQPARNGVGIVVAFTNVFTLGTCFQVFHFFFLKGIVLAVLLEALENEEKNLDGYCIDGYPRTIEQLDEFKQKVT